MLLQAYRWNVTASMTTGIARALVRARRRRYPKPKNIVPSLCPLCLSITAVGAELRVSVLCAYTRILPALSVAGVPTIPKSCQNLTRDLCFHVNICSLPRHSCSLGGGVCVHTDILSAASGMFGLASSFSVMASCKVNWETLKNNGPYHRNEWADGYDFSRNR